MLCSSKRIIHTCINWNPHPSLKLAIKISYVIFKIVLPLFMSLCHMRPSKDNIEKDLRFKEAAQLTSGHWTQYSLLCPLLIKNLQNFHIYQIKEWQMCLHCARFFHITCYLSVTFFVIVDLIMIIVHMLAYFVINNIFVPLLIKPSFKLGPFWVILF